MNAPAADDPLISILVVTFKQHRMLARCLDGLTDATRGFPTETILVVNGVPLQSEHHRAEASGATLLHAPVNLGLPGGLQWARSRARGRHLAVLQDDVELDDQWLAPLVELLERDPTVGAVGSRIHLIDGTPYGDGLLTTGRGYAQNVEPMAQPEAAWYVDACFSASCLVRAEAWDSVRGPDHRLFPNQYVDVDLGLRLAEADWSVVMARDSVARHVRNASTTTRLRGYLVERNSRIVRREHAHTLAERPEDFPSADDVQDWLRHLASVAERRRNSPTPPRTLIPPVSLPTLVRDARSAARRIRIGAALFPARVALHRLRTRNLSGDGQGSGLGR